MEQRIEKYENYFLKIEERENEEIRKKKLFEEEEKKKKKLEELKESLFFANYNPKNIFVEKISENSFKIKKIGYNNNWESNISTNDIPKDLLRVTAKVTFLNIVEHHDLMGGVHISSFYKNDESIYGSDKGSKICSKGFLFSI